MQLLGSSRVSAFTCALGLLALSLAVPAIAQDTLVATGSVWSYLDNGTNQGTAWRAPSFNDGGWATGAAQLGYGDGDENTVVSFGSSSNSKYITTYFRHSFNVADPSIYGSLNLRLQRDDGAVVYLNGTEVYRNNLPGGTVSFTTTASSAIAGADESLFLQTSVASSLLTSGNNVVAVEIHQSSGSSSDISFDLELQGLTGSGSVIVNRGPYLQIGTPSSVVVKWRTDVASDSRVRYGTDPANLNLIADNAALTTEHQVQLSGLTTETTYFYSVGTTSETLAGDNTSTFFTTAPPVGSVRPTRIWAIGDSGTANADARAVRDAYKGFTGGTYTNLWLMLGDNAYNDGTDSEYQAAVFDTYPEVLRQTVLWSTLGNHDGHTADSASQSGPYYDIFTFPKNAEAGGVASGTEAYFSFDYANIHFIVLESYETDRSTNGAMMTWLQQDLAAATADWLIAFWHHPPYTKGSHNSDSESNLVQMRENFLPVLESFGVDLVLSGHSHSYERSMLIDGHYDVSSTFTGAMAIDSGSGRTDGDGAYSKGPGLAANDGAVYIVAGSSGKISGGQLNHAAMYISLNQLGSVVVDIDGLELNARFINDSGGMTDYFTISKGSLTTCSVDADCDDGVACTTDTCNAGLCDNTPDNSACDNGIFCDGGETCSASVGCQAGGDPCPGSFCDEAGDFCFDCAVDADCDDGQFCNGAETCDAGSCNAGGEPCPGLSCDEGGDVCFACAAAKESCTVNSDCCSNKCKGKSGAKTCK